MVPPTPRPHQTCLFPLRLASRITSYPLRGLRIGAERSEAEWEQKPIGDRPLTRSQGAVEATPASSCGGQGRNHPTDERTDKFTNVRRLGRDSSYHKPTGVPLARRQVPTRPAKPDQAPQYEPAQGFLGRSQPHMYNQLRE
jgi:hypothetical protein